MVPPTVNAVAAPVAINLPFDPPKNLATPANLFSPLTAKSFAMAAPSFIAPLIKTLVSPKTNLPRPVPNIRYKDRSFFQCLPRKSIILKSFSGSLVWISSLPILLRNFPIRICFIKLNILSKKPWTGLIIFCADLNNVPNPFSKFSSSSFLLSLCAFFLSNSPSLFFRLY